MPLFDYECQKCQHQFTEVVAINQKEKIKCPKCGSKKVKKIFTKAPKIQGLTRKN